MNIVPTAQVKRNLAILGAGAGGGAIVGAAIGGGVGAIVGSAIGAGAATTHWLLVQRSANLPVSSVLIFSLTDPMVPEPGSGREDRDSGSRGYGSVANLVHPPLETMESPSTAKAGFISKHSRTA